MGKNNKILFLIAALFFIAACSVEKNTAVSRAYHNLTAHYNAYFNGKDAFKQGTKRVAESLQDNYSLILPVFPHSDESAISSASGQMDVAIKKASKVIKLHSITNKPKRKKKGRMTDKEKAFYSKTEYCKWIDDSWQLMGQSHFYKHDFFLAKEALEYIIKEYSDNPIKFRAMIWLARTHNELKEYEKAIGILENAEGDKDFPKKLTKDLALTYADNYLKQQKYEDAIPYLSTAIEKENKKRQRARYQYILAQIYQKYKQYRNASNLYRLVIKANPEYEMAFNAKINRATSFDVTHGDSKEIKKQLNKMARDDKNLDYLDQIYYALANIEYKEGNINTSIELYKKSATESVANTDQKAMSFLALADIYFGRKDYMNAQFYYDSTMVFLSTQHPDYNELSLKTKNLTDLVDNLYVVYNEDSLQKIALLSEKERFKIIDGLIQKVKEEEERLRQLEQQQQLNAQNFYQNRDQIDRYNAGGSGGKWYFYNPAALSFGRSQFIKKWGKRKLEDNWRRKNKAIVNIVDDELAEETVDSTKKLLDNKSREFYLQDLPLNDSLMELSHAKIVDALYRAGGVYKDQLMDFPKSIETFEELNKRYPGNIYELNSYYQLYKLAVLVEDKPKAEHYKNLIINKYPESNYASALTNPNYLQEIAQKEEANKQFYIDTYKLYLKRNYFKVIENCNLADSTLKESPLMSKFSLLKALSIGSIRDLSNFRMALKYVIKTYPDTDEKTTAEVLFSKVSEPGFAFADSGLVAYNGSSPFYTIENIEDPITQDSIQTDTVTEVNIEDLFSFDAAAPHFYTMIIDKNADINRLKFNIMSYNVDNFSMFDFNVSETDYNATKKIITIKMLDSKRQALAYFSRLKRDIDQFFLNMKPRDYTHFIITQDNFSVLINDKNLEKYLEYYKQKYEKE